jgi:hypothetical protein
MDREAIRAECRRINGGGICGDVCQRFACILPPGHRGDHGFGIYFWPATFTPTPSPTLKKG